VNVEFSEEAHGQVRQIDAWWRDNRRGAPDLFTEELDRALRDLGDTPTLGGRYEAKAIRRLLLPRTHYHLYCVHEVDRIFVVAVWSAFRGRGPEL
jgi:plasmid stabilization system protein ParE